MTSHQEEDIKEDLDWLRVANDSSLLRLFDSLKLEPFPGEGVLASVEGFVCRVPIVKQGRLVDRTPQPIALVISHYALYIFPAPVRVDDCIFLVLNEYERLALHDVALISLPYEEVVNAHGDEYAHRVDDVVLHLKSGIDVWLRTQAGKRSSIVNCIYDTYAKLTNVELDIENPELSVLVRDMSSHRILQTIKERKREYWARAKPVKEGFLLYRCEQHLTSNAYRIPAAPPSHQHVECKQTPRRTRAVSHHNNSSRNSSNSNNSNQTKQGKNSEKKESNFFERLRHKYKKRKEEEERGKTQYLEPLWTRRWVALYDDNHLLHFASKQEMDAVCAVAQASSARYKTKFPDNFEVCAVDLTQCLLQKRGRPFGFDLVTWLPSEQFIGYRKFTRMHRRAPPPHPLGSNRNALQPPAERQNKGKQEEQEEEEEQQQQQQQQLEKQLQGSRTGKGDEIRPLPPPPPPGSAFLKASLSFTSHSGEPIEYQQAAVVGALAAPDTQAVKVDVDATSDSPLIPVSGEEDEEETSRARSQSIGVLPEKEATEQICVRHLFRTCQDIDVCAYHIDGKEVIGSPDGYNSSKNENDENEDMQMWIRHAVASITWLQRRRKAAIEAEKS